MLKIWLIFTRTTMIFIYAVKSRMNRMQEAEWIGK